MTAGTSKARQSAPRRAISSGPCSVAVIAASRHGRCDSGGGLEQVVEHVLAAHGADRLGRDVAVPAALRTTSVASLPLSRLKPSRRASRSNPVIRKLRRE